MADGDGAATRTVMTVEELRALKGAARYDAMREVIETKGSIEDEGADDVFRRLCIRRAWPKRLGKHPTLAEFGRANRWNFKPYDDLIRGEDSMLPPSLSASSPDALYRLLHVVEPKRLVHPMDYYKGGVFRFYSVGRRFMCWVGFHKCEIDLSFYCPPEDLFVPARPRWPFTYANEEERHLHWTDSEEWARRKFAIPGNREAFDAYQAAEQSYNDQGVVVPWCSGRMRCKSPDGAAWMRLVVAVANTPWDIYPGNDFRV